MRHTLGILLMGAVAFGLSAITACSGGGGGGSGDGSGAGGIGNPEETGIRILLTDAPGALKSVKVNIVEIAVHQPGGPFTTVPLTATNEDTDFDGIDDVVVEGDGSVTVDLVALQGTTAMMAASTLAPGKYTMIRFIVSKDAEGEFQNGDKITLKIPGGKQTGIKIGVPFEVEAGFMTDVLLDWDVDSSVVFRGKNDRGILKPVITSPQNTPASLRWQMLSPAAPPSGRDRHDMVFDSVCDVIVLYGGNDGTTDLKDTWEYDPNTDVWNLTDANSPPGPRRLHRMSYDSARDKTVMFSGSSGGLKNDTWEYDAGTWTNVIANAVAGSPPARFAFDMDYDAKRGLVVLFGRNGFADNDIWEFDGAAATWTKPVLAGPKPSARAGVAIVYHSIDERIVLFGGRDAAAVRDDLWVYDGSWTLILADGAAGNPPARRQHDLAYDASRNQLVLFGGRGMTAATVYGDTVEYDGTSWVETFSMTSPGVPSERWNQAMVVYDDHRNRLMLFGGRMGTSRLNDLWLYGWMPLDL
ncbi:MAG: DUF4382 domain-containing protein [Planctomycetota bacterium]|nr:DUF4382 domain-containing protein [Planctomycetota bacterium]